MADSAIRQTFTVPAGAGDLAPETLIAAQPNLEIAPLVEALPASAEVEIEVLRVEGDTTEDTDWIPSGIAAITAVGLIRETTFATYPVRIRVRSQGTPGVAVVSFRSWH